MATQRILVPLDGSDLSERILVHVQRLLVHTDAEVTLLQVIAAKAAAQGQPGTDPFPIAREYLERLRDVLIVNGARVRARIVVGGDAAARILDVASELEASLIAMSTHGRSGLSRFARGSVAERVLRSATVPVLAANPAALPEHQPGGLRRILVPLDGSEMSAEVLPLAADIAKLFAAELILLYSIETVAVAGPVAILSSAMSRDEALARLQTFARRVTDVPVRLRVTSGTPAIGILDVAREEQADLIAMTTHGRSGFSRWAFGSVAEHVLRHGACPLLLKRTAGVEEAPAAAPPTLPASGSRESGGL